MTRYLIAGALLASVLVHPAQATEKSISDAEAKASPYAGDWLAPAEDADDVDAIITLTQQGRVWHGHIKQILLHGPTQKITDNTVCEACSGPQHGHPYRGLEVIWDLQDTAGKLSAGRILDPGDGQIYQCEIQLLANGTLRVNAYKGLPFLGHTMTWTKTR